MSNFKDSPSLNKCIPKKAPHISEDAVESSPMLFKSSQKLHLSHIELSQKKPANPPQNALPIRIQYQPLQNPQRVTYQRVTFPYNSDMEKIHDFNSFDWNYFKYADFLSFMHSTKQNPRDYMRFAKNNHKDPFFLQSAGNLSEKLLEIAYFDSEAGPLSHITFSGDRKSIISMSAHDNSIKIWDSNEFRLRGVLEGFDDKITSFYTCFRSDILITCSLDFNIIVWDLERMEEMRRISNIHSEEVTKIAMNNEETRLFSISKDGFLKIIDWETMKVLRIFNVLKTKAILDFCFSEDEKFLVLCGNDRKLQVFDNHNNLYESSFALISDKFRGFSQITFFSLDSRKKLLSLADDSSILIWDFELKIQEKTLIPHIHQITKFLVLSETSQIISINRQNFLQIWNVKNGKELIRKKAQGNLTNFDLIRKKNDSTNIYKFQLITSSKESLITIWGVAEIDEFNHIFQYQKPISHITVTLDNKYVIFSSDNIINMLDLASNRIEKTFFLHTGPITALYLASDSKTLISGSGLGDFSIKIWDLEKGLGEETLKKHQSEVILLAISPDFTYFLSGSADQMLVLWDYKKKKEKAEIKNIGLMKKVVFSDNSQFFTGGKEGTIKQWKVDPFEEIRSLSAHANEISGLDYLESSNVLLSGSLDGTLKMWKFEGRDVFLIKVIENNVGILNFAISPEEKSVVLVDEKRNVKSFCLETTFLEESFDFASKTDEKIALISAFQDCKKLLLAGDGGGVFIWEYRDPKFMKSFVLNDILENIDDNERLSIIWEKDLIWKAIFCQYIYPVKANFLHYLAYLGESEKLRRVFSILTEKGQFSLVFQKDLFGNTPIDILFDQKDITSVFYLLNLSIDNTPSLHYFPNITDIIRKISKLNFHNLPQLLDSRLLIMNQRNGVNNKEKSDFLLFPSGFFIGKKVTSMKSAAVTQPEELMAKKVLIHLKEGEPAYSGILQILDIPDLLNEEKKEKKKNGCIFENLTMNEGILESEVMRLLVEHKWEIYAKNIYYFRIFYYFFIMLMLVVYSVWLLPLRVRFISDFSRITTYGLVNLIFLCFLSFFMLLYWFSELYKLICLGLIGYLSYVKNLYFILSLSLFTITLIFDWCGLYNVYFDEDLIRNLHAFNLYFFTLGFFFFLKPFTSFSVGRLFFRVLDNIKVYTALLVILIYNFGFIIFILDQSWSFAENYSDATTVVYWKQPFETFDLVYRIMIRDFNQFDYEPRPLYMIVLWVFFLITTFLIIIVMLSIFIAVVFELEQELRRNKEVSVLKEKLQIVLEIDKTFLKGKFEKYLFVSRIYEGKNQRKGNDERNLVKDREEGLMKERDLKRLEEKIMDRLEKKIDNLK